MNKTEWNRTNFRHLKYRDPQDVLTWLKLNVSSEEGDGWARALPASHEEMLYDLLIEDDNLFTLLCLTWGGGG